jgi:hypothetical protein
MWNYEFSEKDAVKSPRWVTDFSICPFCRKKSLGVKLQGYVFRVKCNKCGITGPSGEAVHLALEGFAGLLVNAYELVREQGGPDGFMASRRFREEGSE